MSSHTEIDAIFKALASPVRRAILDALKDAPQTTGELCATFEDFSRCAVMQHLGVLTDAGLVIAIKRGRQRWNHFNAMPIKTIHDRWIGPHAAEAANVLSRLKTGLEDEGSSDESITASLEV